MPARSKITMLPPEIKAEVNRLLIERNFSGYDEIVAAVNDKLAAAGLEITLTRSGVHRYGQEFEEKCAAIKIATEQATAIVGVVGDDEGNMNEALIRLIQQQTFDILLKNKDEDISSLLPKIGVMVAKLSKASVDQRKDRRELRRQAKEEAANVVDEMAKQQGMNEEQARFWREKVLMGA